MTNEVVQLHLCHKCGFVLGKKFVIHQEKQVILGKGLINGNTYFYHEECEPNFIERSLSKKEIPNEIA